MILSPAKRLPWTLICSGLILFLAWQMFCRLPPPRVGDGGEYYLMTIALAEKFQPFGDPEIDRIYDSYCSNSDGSFPTSKQINKASADLSVRVKPTETGPITFQQDYPHFWFYSLMASPFYLFAKVTGVDISHSFSLLHLILFGLLLVIAEKEFGRRGIVLAAMICLASPLLWFIDKAHTEFFTVALGTIGVIYQLKHKSSYAFLAFCIIATQNPPFGLVAMFVLVEGMLRKKADRETRSLANVSVIALGLGILALHPLYYQLRHGSLTPQLITGAASSSSKGIRELTCFVIDPDVGLISNWPWIVVPIISVAIYALWTRQSIQWRTVSFCAISLFILAWAQTKTNNFNHGGTVKISRYALWYIPFLLPLLLQFASNYRMVPAWQRVAVYGFLAAALAINTIKFHPVRKESFLYQTTIAENLYNNFPELYDPVPEIFIERCIRAELPTKAWAVSNRSGTKIIVHRGRLRKQQISQRKGRPIDPILGGNHLIDPIKLVEHINSNVELPESLDWFYVNAPGDLQRNERINVAEAQSNYPKR